jgi:hypothetical protein
VNKVNVRSIERAAAVVLGVAAWVAVAGIAISAVWAWGTSEPLLTIVTVAAGAVVAWRVGRFATAWAAATEELEDDAWTDRATDEW